MKTKSPHTVWRSGLFMLFAFLLYSGCDAQLFDLAKDQIEEPELAELHTTLSQDLGLTGSTEAEVRRVFVEHQRNHGAPGNLWRIAAALHDRLSDEQKQRLFALIEEYEDRLAKSGKIWMFDNWVAPTGPPPGRPNCNPQLTPEQLEEVKALRERFAAVFRELKAAFEAGEISEREFRRQSQALREALQSAYEDILTPEQLRRIRACQNYANEQLRNSSGPGLKIMIQVLELDREQVRALEQLQRDQRESFALLIRKLKADEIDRHEFIRGIVRLREARETALKDILDRRQYEIVKIHQALTLRIMVNRMLASQAG